LNPPFAFHASLWATRPCNLPDRGFSPTAPITRRYAANSVIPSEVVLKLAIGMKRILLSLAISFVLFAGYLIGVGILLEFVIGHSEEGSHFSTPLLLPVLVQEYFFGIDRQDDSVSALVVASLGNVFLYAFPIYGILSLLARRKRSDVEAPEPPPPPTFDT
jgi:hypothetical protein